MAAEEPAPLVDGGQEPPDVLDVGVGEGEVVAAPVHPLPESDRPLREIGGGALDDGPAAAGELGQPELLDLALRVEAELALDADLDPQPLAVEAVLVALVVAPERLVALEDVLERATPRRVDGERLVGRDGAVDEAEAGSVGVLRAELIEGALAGPEIEDPLLEGVMIRLLRDGGEHDRAILRAGGNRSGVLRARTGGLSPTRRVPTMPHPLRGGRTLERTARHHGSYDQGGQQGHQGTGEEGRRHEGDHPKGSCSGQEGRDDEARPRQEGDGEEGCRPPRSRSRRRRRPRRRPRRRHRPSRWRRRRSSPPPRVPARS